VPPTAPSPYATAWVGALFRLPGHHIQIVKEVRDFSQLNGEKRCLCACASKFEPKTNVLFTLKIAPASASPDLPSGPILVARKNVGTNDSYFYWDGCFP